MTFRERLADWISGGAISEATRDFKIAAAAAEEHETIARENRRIWKDKAIKRALALRTIIDQETPGANATVKRMARIAREGLK
jgi:hypothetical protein